VKPRTNEERMDRLWHICSLLIAANRDLLERLCEHEPHLRGELEELDRVNRALVTRLRWILEKEGVSRTSTDERIAKARARFAANPLGFDIVGQESEPPWEMMLPQRRRAAL
jgi:hypothetical protein